MVQPEQQPSGSGTRLISNYGTISSNHQTIPKPKPIVNPSRIEPKVWFANERTWLNWCRTGLLLGTFGIALVNCSPSTGARLLGVVYTLIAVGTISYGWIVYQKRIRMIKDKFPGHFDELLAPILIALALFLAILLNFIFRAIDR
ncbi:hypothetical protein DFH28DRAFT_288710 [Melampsora americana]|nr:hypothetical protein DFH28DRAFT_288710 [Melampsora americana]